MRSLSGRFGPVVGAVLLIGVGYIFGTLKSDPLAAQPGKAVIPASGTAPAPVPAAGDKRVIAYINGGTPITREEFGDYLIDLVGKERVRLYVNRRIIEAAAAKRGIVVTPQEVEAIISEDCRKLGMQKDQFIKVVLAQKYGKTIEEWREDVIKPRLMVQAMCKAQLKIDDAELKKIYENLYGEKVQCRVILWPKGSEKEIMRVYDDLRKSEAAFDEAARTQPYKDLAANGGKVDPVGRHSGPSTAKFEEIAFHLKDGQVSEMIDTGGGLMVIKRVGSVSAKTSVTFESVKAQLVQETTDRQMDELVPKMFAQLNEEAKPLFILSPADLTSKEMDERTKRLTGVDPGDKK
jgi:PPIC-type PPIASE domain